MDLREKALHNIEVISKYVAAFQKLAEHFGMCVTVKNDLDPNAEERIDCSVAVFFGMSEEENLGSITFFANDLQRVFWRVQWYTGLIEINGSKVPGYSWQAGQKGDIKQFLNILTNRTIPGEKKKKRDLRKVEILEANSEWTTH
jgi:hypothetical protein